MRPSSKESMSALPEKPEFKQASFGSAHDEIPQHTISERNPSNDTIDLPRPTTTADRTKHAEEYVTDGDENEDDTDDQSETDVESENKEDETAGLLKEPNKSKKNYDDAGINVANIKKGKRKRKKVDRLMIGEMVQKQDTTPMKNTLEKKAKLSDIRRNQTNQRSNEKRNAKPELELIDMIKQQVVPKKMAKLKQISEKREKQQIEFEKSRNSIDFSQDSEILWQSLKHVVDMKRHIEQLESEEKIMSKSIHVVCCERLSKMFGMSIKKHPM
eukprot:jgi/Bigna1/87775/estExt_fgenesh1_pg.C_240049